MLYRFNLEVAVSSSVGIEKIHRALYDILVRELNPHYPLSVVEDFKIHVVRDTPKEMFVCRVCKKKFHPRGRCSRLPKYCSNSCKTKAYRLRKLFK